MRIEIYCWLCSARINQRQFNHHGRHAAKFTRASQRRPKTQSHLINRGPLNHDALRQLQLSPRNCANYTKLAHWLRLWFRRAKIDAAGAVGGEVGRSRERERANASAAHLLDNDGGRLRRWWFWARYTAQGDEQRSLQPSLRRCVKSVALLEGKYTGVGFAEPSCEHARMSNVQQQSFDFDYSWNYLLQHKNALKVCKGQFGTKRVEGIKLISVATHGTILHPNLWDTEVLYVDKSHFAESMALKICGGTFKIILFLLKKC